MHEAALALRGLLCDCLAAGWAYVCHQEEGQTQEVSYILWNPALLDNPAFCALMAESPDYLGLWFRCLQIASAAGQEGELRVFGGKPLNPKALALAHFRSASPQPLELAAGFLELATELGLLDLVDGVLVVAWWSEFGKELHETREAWRQRKERQRAKARETREETPRDVSRDCPVTVTETPGPNNQNKQPKQTNKQASKQPTPETQAPPQPAKPLGRGALAKALAHGAEDPQAVLARLAEHNAKKEARPP